MSLTVEVGKLIESVDKLTEEVINKQAIIDETVNNTIAELNNWKLNVKAKDIAGEPRYNSIIDLTGLSTERYYPVWWAFPANNNGENKITISRDFNENREQYPFGQGVTHLASLYLQMEGSDCAWGGGATHLSIVRLSQNYRNTVKMINFAMKCIARPISGNLPLYNGAKNGDAVNCHTKSGVYLRGGLTYHVVSNVFASVDYSRSDDEVEIARAIQQNNNFEIKWTAKSYAINDPFLGNEYGEYREAYNLPNDSRYTRKA